MIDIKRIKEDPDGVKAGFHAKEIDCDEYVDRILELDAQRRSLILSTESKKAEESRRRCCTHFQEDGRTEG